MVELAKAMKHEMDLSVPFKLKPGEWHLPYILPERNLLSGELHYFTDYVFVSIPLEDAKLISTSCCAQVSYRNLDMSLLKAVTIVGRLADRNDPHLSPFEHQATPMKVSDEEGWMQMLGYWGKGVTHLDKAGNYWSANFQGWIQNRQLMEV